MDLAHFLPIIVYILLIVFLVICIIIGIKVVKAMDKIDRIADNIEGKVNSLNGIFSVVDKTANRLNAAYDKTSGLFSKIVSKVASIKNKGKDEDEYE